MWKLQGPVETGPQAERLPHHAPAIQVASRLGHLRRLDVKQPNSQMARDLSRRSIETAPEE